MFYKDYPDSTLFDARRIMFSQWNWPQNDTIRTIIKEITWKIDLHNLKLASLSSPIYKTFDMVLIEEYKILLNIKCIKKYIWFGWRHRYVWRKLNWEISAKSVLTSYCSLLRWFRDVVRVYGRNQFWKSCFYRWQFR